MVDNRLEQLWAIHEIRQLALNYSLAVDTRDWALMQSLWVETDEPLPFPHLDIHVMRDMAPDHYKMIGTCSHFVCNHLVDIISPDRATGSVYSLCYEEAEVFAEQAILYQDVYEQHDGKWLFLHRNHLLWWGREAVNPMHQAPADWPNSQVGAGIAFDRIRLA